MPPRLAHVPTVDPSLHQTPPFFVHPSDGPSSVSVTPVLSVSNYHSCTGFVHRALGAKMMFDFLDGSILLPKDSFNLSFCAWNRCNMLIHSCIMDSVDDSISQLIYCFHGKLC